MVDVPLVDLKTRQAIDAYRVEDQAVEISFPVIFSGTAAATDVQMGKIGDIYIKTDTSNVYIAKGVTKATDWVEVSTAA